ncbi:hypothetical protein DL98DRAFT_537963 [Cadophora sp. DSE1049]|nr:hypothetical protein DL98DRAFT_537963 [Cadophora sp. DSE1049]
MSPGSHDYFSCGCSIFTFEATCTLYLCKKHNESKPRLLERDCNPCQHVKDVALELTPVSSSTFANTPQAQAEYQFNSPQTQNSFQNANLESSPNEGPSFAALMTQFCNQAREDEDNERGIDLNDLAMSGGNGEGSQVNYSQGYVMNGRGMENNDADIGIICPEAMQANNSGYGAQHGHPVQTNNFEHSSENGREDTRNTQKPFRINDLYNTIIDASAPFLHSVITSSRNASTNELQLSKQATNDALYNSIRHGLDEATSLRDIDINCERANVKHWIQDIKEGRSTLEDMEMGLWLSGEAKDLGRAMNAERIKERILGECMEILNANL